MECPKRHADALDYEAVEGLDQRGYGQPGYDMACDACDHEWKGHPVNIDDDEDAT